MCVPIIFLRQRLINAVVEVLVVRKDDMTADIVQLYHISACYLLSHELQRRTKPSLVTSVEARPPGISFESTIIHDGPF